MSKTPIGVLQSAAFMVAGLHNADIDKANEAWDNGMLELVTELVQHADFAHELYENGYKLYGSLPGVFDYEVSSLFGRWFGEYVKMQSDVPTAELSTKCLEEYAQSFFAEYEKERVAALAPKAKFKCAQVVYTLKDKAMRRATVREVHTVEGLAIGKSTFKYVVVSDTSAGFQDVYEMWEHSVFATPNAAFGLPI
jgi:hypothetical protein